MKGCKAFCTVIQKRGTTKRIAGLLLKWKMRAEEMDIDNLILNSNYLSLTNTQTHKHRNESIM